MAAENRMEPPDTADLVGRAAAGDRAAFTEIVRRYHATVYRWAVISLADQDEAEDVSQLVLIKVHEALGSFRGGAKFTTWLYRITINVLSDRARKEQRRSALLSADGRGVGDTGTRENAGEIDATRFEFLVRHCMASLPTRQREVFELADLQGVAPTEIAQMLDMEPVTVRTNLLKARRAVRAKMLLEQPKLMEEYRS